MTTSAHLAQHSGHLLPLALGTQVGTKLPLGDLESTLVLAYLQQLSNTLLVGSESSDLADEVADETGALAELALAGGGTLGDVALGNLVAPVQTDGDAVAHHGWSHAATDCGVWTLSSRLKIVGGMEFD